MGSSASGVSRLNALPTLFALFAVLAGALGLLGLAWAGDGLSHRQFTVDSVPMTEVRAVDGSGKRPGVVVTHGFAASQQLMTPIADTLARRGYVVMLLDFAGHGRNPAPLPDAGRDTPAGTDTLAAGLDATIGQLRSRPDVDPDRIGLVGHSMGADAVIRYAVEHPDIAATVTISLPSADELPDASGPPRTGGPPGAAERPRSLLLIVGGVEFDDFKQAATEAVRRGGPGADRRAVVIPAVEHISVLFAGRTHDETLSWLDAKLAPPPAPGDGIARPIAYLVPAGLLLAGFVLGLYPMAVALLGRAGRTSHPRPPILVVLTATVAATALGAGLARVLPTDRLPLAMGGYVGAFLAVAGLALTAVAHLQGKRTNPPLPEVANPSRHEKTGPLTSPAVRVARGPVRLGLAGVLLIGYAVAAVAVPLDLGVTSAVPAGARWWLLPLVVAACWLFLYGAERLTGGGPAYPSVCAVAIVMLTAAPLAGLAPGFMLLVVPLFGLVLAWQVIWAVVLRQLAAPGWLIALVGAVLLGWPIATTLPLTT